MNKPRIVVITPVRNEENYLQDTILMMVHQTLQPVEWILVDDGSTDETATIIRQASEKFDWIHGVYRSDRGARAVGPGVVQAFKEGYKNITSKNYDYICKMDGDIQFGVEYFEALVRYFEKDSRLGAASGKIFFEVDGALKEERMSDEMVCGAVNFYRRECFNDIGGFVTGLHWDGIAYHRSRIEGWKTESFRGQQLKIIHKRQMGSSHKSIIHGRLRWGLGQWFMGTHFIYLLAICLYRMLERPWIIGGLFIGLGYLQGKFKRLPRYGNNKFRKSLHAWQFERLGLGRRLERTINELS